ncbi:MAG: outer membrane homotrimeric porin [Desulfovibrio sp.]|jgi:hypothetical protein|nr:outer membrane homotrimeric porin [Desulfovibrio sp.]
MKRVLTLALAAALALSLAGAAWAVEVKFSGEWNFAFGWADNEDFHDGDGEDDFLARQRLRTQAEFIVSENLSGVLQLEIGNLEWGRDAEDGGKVGEGAGGSIDTDGVNVETRLAYVDWVIPSTDVSVRMGLQDLILPDATGWGNPVLNSDLAAVAVSIPFTEQIGLTAIWARPFDASGSDNDDNHNLADEMDIFALILPIDCKDLSFNLTPWAAYSRVGASSGFLEYVLGNSNNDAFAAGGIDSVRGGDSADIWWGGLAFELSAFDPLTFGLDFMYGHTGKLEYEALDEDETSLGDMDFRTSGWLLAATLDYALDWGSVGIFGWYASGDDADDAEDGEYGRLPALGFDNGFAPTGFGGPGSFSIGSDTAVSATFLGTWGVGLKLGEWSFVEDLSHTLRLSYYRGTNEHDVVEGGYGLAFSGESVYLTDKDSAFEINFDHNYKIYENLELIVELGYIHLSLDDDVWDNIDDDYAETSNAWKAQALLQYNF